MARLQPKPSTVKKLFALSGNKCAFPTCKTPMISENGEIIGEICHIEAANEEGERFNANQSDEDRRGFENLILLCSNHHKETNDIKQYTVEILKKLKAEHESKHVFHPRQVSDQEVSKAIEKYIEQSNSNQAGGSQFNNQAENQNIGSQIGTQNINNYMGQGNDTKPKIEGLRPVDKELKKAIDEFREKASPPDMTVIDFRNEESEGKERAIETIPHKFLKFRKENGRIKSEVLSHEKIHEVSLDEKEDETQDLLREFLEKSDPEKKDALKEQLRKIQRHPAIITCDGFLINGNRRKMVYEELYSESNEDPKYENMRVVILPETVTELDISKIENRYQMQDEGKSEYSGINRAITLRDNIDKGYNLKAQLRDDPRFMNKINSELDTEVKKIEKELIKPLEAVDRYLDAFNKPGLYNTISESVGDKQGRWQAFIDYSAFYSNCLMKAEKRRELGIKDGEEGKIENAIFKIIRKRSLNSKEMEKSLGKVHAFVRASNLKKYIQNEIAKKHLINISNQVEEVLSEREKIDENGTKYSEREIDEKWGNKYKNEILGNLMQAYKAVYNQDERDKPLDLLEDALKKLNHENLKIKNMDIEHYSKALELCKKISVKADDIYSQVDHSRGNLKKLKTKHNH
ncbi:hypothetical protein [Reichenbachiella sp.]|uniref:hypothetical protein n=1 Tax=Reichenbachiella sp. TaxID=2184521 RepID=UPI0032978B48